MWIVLNKSFLSIVENRNNKIELLVRSRVKGDIEKVFSETNVFEDNTADYKIPRSRACHLQLHQLLNMSATRLRFLRSSVVDYFSTKHFDVYNISLL